MPTYPGFRAFYLEIELLVSIFLLGFDPYPLSIVTFYMLLTGGTFVK